MQDFEQTKQLLDNSNIYYLIAVDMNSKYSYVNKRYQRIFESVHGPLVGQHYAITMHPQDLEICHSVSARAFGNPDEIFPAIIRKHDGKGGFVITQWEYKAMFNDQQQPTGVFCIGHDITKFMQNSTELKDTRESLQQTKLSLDQIRYIQSHVVRKPIANIMGLSMLLQTMPMDADLASIFEMVNESARELDIIIRNMGTE